MGTIERPAVAALVSLVAEDLTAVPASARSAADSAIAADPAHRSVHLVDATYAALLAGEPKRAQVLLARLADEPDGAAFTRHAEALQVWAAQLDRNWYPGNTGAETPGGDLPVLTPPTEPAPDETILVEQVVAAGPIGMLTPRSLLDALLAQGRDAEAQELVASTLGVLARTAEYGRVKGHPGLALWAHLTQVQAARRAGLDTDNGVLARVREVATDAGLPAYAVLTDLVEGDGSATPGSSPEALGFDLAPRPVPSRRASSDDLRRAGECYARAEETASAAGLSGTAPALWAAIHLRTATLAWLEEDAPQRRRSLDVAAEAARSAGAAALSRLIDVHLLLADIAEGSFAAAMRDIGSGWSSPTQGRLAEVRRWAESDGSTSWCAGLGRLLERAGNAWERKQEHERASLAYLAALHLLSIEPALPSHTLMTAVAQLDARRNLSARSLARLERLLTTLPAVTDVQSQLYRFSEEIEVLMAMVAAQRNRARTAAAEHAARGLERVRTRLRLLVDAARRAGIEGTDPDSLDRENARIRTLMTGDKAGGLAELLRTDRIDVAVAAMVSFVVGTAEGQLAMIDVLVPLCRGEHAERLGHTERADAWYDEALAAAPAGPSFLTPLALTAANRREEARRLLGELVAEGSLSDDLLALLALRADDAEVAAAAFARTGADPARTPDWRVALTGAELALAQDDPARALGLADHGVALLEAGMARLIRDTDRVAAADDPDAASLYMTATLACLELAERGIDADSHRTRALSYTDRARSLALDPLLRGDEVAGSPAAGRWREAAASWAADVDRLLAAIDADPPADTGAVLAAVDASEERLRALEVDLDDADPGTLVRRAHPRAPAQFGSLVAEFAPGTALLEFHTVGDDLVVAAVTGGGIEIARRPVRTRRLAALARRYHARCVEGRGAGPEADELASLLLEPVAEVLRAHHRLVVVPFGPLYSVPVHALAFDGEPLGRTRTVSYAPSAALGIPTDQPIPRGSAAVVGDPAFDPALHPRLRRLPGAEIEARAVAARLGCTEPLIGEAADEATVRRLLPDRAVLHLATHGWLNELGPYASSLVLAGRDSLVVSELVGMRLSARLAVLSACDTGRGAATLGGDVIGLTRALLAAGVRQTVVSLWPVDDRTACLTMAAFHDALGRGDPPAAALTHAQGVVHDLDAAGMRDAYATLCREVGSTSARLDAGDRRRGELDDELADNEPLPEPLGGSAERHWAPFILIDASQPRMGQTRMRQT